MRRHSWSLLASITLAIACRADDAALGPQPTPPIVGKRLADTFAVNARISGVVTRRDSIDTSGKSVFVLLYAYFEGDSAARGLGVTAVLDKTGAYAASISDRLVVRSDSAVGARPRRRWRAMAVAFPIEVPASPATVVVGDWIVRTASDTTSLSLTLDIGMLDRGGLPEKLPVPIATGLPLRAGNADLSTMTDSLRQLGGDVVIRITSADPAPLIDLFDTPAATVSLADAGLRYPAGHGGFVTFEDWRSGDGSTYLVWGRLTTSESPSIVIDRIAALPFVKAIQPLKRRNGDEPLRTYPTLDSAPISSVDRRRFVWVAPPSFCYYTRSEAWDGASRIACGELVLGRKAGISSANLVGELNGLGARVTYESPDWQVADGLRYTLISVPLGSERRALSVFTQHPLLRYAMLNPIGGLL